MPMLPQSPLVVTVIPNWNLKADLLECLRSLQSVTRFSHQIVVVDNGSSDGSPEEVERQFPLVRVICLRENRGFAAAVNVGIEWAVSVGAKYVFALNNDTVVKPGAIETLVQVCDRHSDLAVLAPKVLYYDEPWRLYRMGDRRKWWSPLPVSYGVRKPDGAEWSGLFRFDYVSGCAMLLRSSCLKSVGLLDESFFMYYEDAEFCRRVRDSGLSVATVGGAVVLHKASVSARREKVLIRQLRMRNQIWFYRRCPHGPHRWLTMAAVVARLVVILARDVTTRNAVLVLPSIRGVLDGLLTRQTPRIPMLPILGAVPEPDA